MCRAQHEHGGRRCRSSYGVRRSAVDRARYARRAIITARSATVAMNAAAAEVRQSDTDLGTVAVAPVVAVPQAPVTLFISNRRQRQEILAKIGAGVTVVSAERRTSTTAAFVPWAHPTLGKRLVVAGVEDGQPLLSDGSQFSVGRAIDWEFSDGLAVHTHTTALTRIAYLLSPVSTAPAPLVPAIDAGDDDDEDDAPLLDALAPSPEKLAAGRQRAAAEAAADFASAVKASIAAAGLPPAQALAAMGDVQEAMRQSSRLLDGALRPIGELSEEEWRAQRDHADGGISLALAIEDNEAWTTRLEAAQRHIRTRIAAETAAGRSVLAEHEWELGEALRGLRATARVLGERKARLDA
jgi:hypothetical protein